MDEREQLIPSLVAVYEFIAKRDSPDFMPLDNSLNRDILHNSRFHYVLSRFVLDGEGIDEE